MPSNSAPVTVANTLAMVFPMPMMPFIAPRKTLPTKLPNIDAADLTALLAFIIQFQPAIKNFSSKALAIVCPIVCIVLTNLFLVSATDSIF